MAETDKRCGACKHYAPIEVPNQPLVYDWGHCNCPLPNCIIRRSRTGMFSDEGENCPMWQPIQNRGSDEHGTD